MLAEDDLRWSSVNSRGRGGGGVGVATLLTVVFQWYWDEIGKTRTVRLLNWQNVSLSANPGRLSLVLRSETMFTALETPSAPFFTVPLLFQAKPNEYVPSLLAHQTPVSFHKHHDLDPLSVYEEYLSWYLRVLCENGGVKLWTNFYVKCLCSTNQNSMFRMSKRTKKNEIFNYTIASQCKIRTSNNNHVRQGIVGFWVQSIFLKWRTFLW